MTLLLLLLTLAWGEEPFDPVDSEWNGQTEVIPGGLPAPGPPPPADQVTTRTEAIAKQLRCPVCQGLSVADSPSHSATTMKGRIERLVEAGYTSAQIEDYFVSRYGEWVLLAPPAHGSNLILWLGPVFLLGGALLWAGASTRGSAPKPKSSSSPAKVPKTSDPYVDRLLRELEEPRS